MLMICCLDSKPIQEGASLIREESPIPVLDPTPLPVPAPKKQDTCLKVKRAQMAYKTCVHSCQLLRQLRMTSI